MSTLGRRSFLRSSGLWVAGTAGLAACSGGGMNRPLTGVPPQSVTLDQIMFKTDVWAIRQGSTFIVRSDMQNAPWANPLNSGVSPSDTCQTKDSNGRRSAQDGCSGDYTDASQLPVIASVTVSYSQGGQTTDGDGSLGGANGSSSTYTGSVFTPIVGTPIAGPVFTIPKITFNPDSVAQCLQLSTEFQEKLSILGNYIAANGTPSMVANAAVAALSGSLIWAAFLDVAMAIMGGPAFLAACAVAGIGMLVIVELVAACSPDVG